MVQCQLTTGLKYYRCGRQVDRDEDPYRSYDGRRTHYVTIADACRQVGEAFFVVRRGPTSPI
jgi:hypothetical protein